MTLPKALILELDGVLADNRHRRHWVLRSRELGLQDWESYYAAMFYDKANDSIVSILSKYVNSYHVPKIIFITGRPEKYLELTRIWVEDNAYIWDFHLLMRSGFLPHYFLPYADPPPLEIKPDNRPSHIVKREIYDREIAGKYDILFALESDDECIDMYRSLGITCLKVVLP